MQYSFRQWLRRPRLCWSPASSATPQSAGPEPCAPDGTRVYAVGDIHGRLDLLEELQGMILADCAGCGGRKVLIYLGDYIDRGAQSKQVLDLLIDRPLAGFETVHLLGNHEQAMLDFIADPETNAAWLSFGGQVTLMSYGVGAGKLTFNQDVRALANELQQNMPDSHRAFLAACRLTHIEGDYCFVHAGIRPGIAMAEQCADDLLWIRDDFLYSRAVHEYVVVHGHNIRDDVDRMQNRIGIDTGAYETGVLTALVLDGHNQRLLQTGVKRA